MKKILLVLPIILFANSAEIEIYKEINPYAKYLSNKKIKKILDRNRLFANEMKKELNKTEYKVIIEDTLAKLYIKRLEKKYAPTEKEIKSFYEEYKNSFEPQTFIDFDVIIVFNKKKAKEVEELFKKGYSYSDIIKKLNIYDKDSGEYKNVSLKDLSPQIKSNLNLNKKIFTMKLSNKYLIYYIKKVTKKHPTYKNLKLEIKKLLINLILQKKIEEEYNKLKAKYEKNSTH